MALTSQCTFPARHGLLLGAPCGWSPIRTELHFRGYFGFAGYSHGIVVIEITGLAAEMSLSSGTAVWDWPKRGPEGNWYAIAAISGQSFETLQALNLGPSDFVPKLTHFETAHSDLRSRRFSTRIGGLRHSCTPANRDSFVSVTSHAEEFYGAVCRIRIGWELVKLSSDGIRPSPVW